MPCGENSTKRQPMKCHKCGCRLSRSYTTVSFHTYCADCWHTGDLIELEMREWRIRDREFDRQRSRRRRG